MPATTPRVLPPTRLVALVLIALVLGGLAYTGLASDQVSVPPDATAGDLTLRPCTYDTEAGPLAADCGTLVVPESRTDPDARLIALPVVRVRARAADPGAPIFRLEGGPGQSNMAFERASRFVEDHDVVMVGYRGIDGSVRLDCPEVGDALSHARDLLTDAASRAYAEAFRDCASRLEADGVDLANYGLVQQADDLEAARIALGHERIHLLSESAGTRTAMIYAWRYPDRVHRSVMVAVNPPGHLLYEAEATDEQLGRFAARCVEDAVCRDRTSDLAATIRRTATDMPDHWLLLPIDGGKVRLLTFFGLMQSTTLFPPGREVTLDAWLAAADGDPSGMWLISTFADLLYPELFVWGQYAAAARVDAEAARGFFASVAAEDRANLGVAATSGAWGDGLLVDAWPAATEERSYASVRPSQVETLLIGGELDLSTPPGSATTELLPALPNGHQVVLPGFSHSPSFWAEQPEAGTRLITTFLDRGVVDDSLYRPQGVDFAPPTTLGTVAGRVLGTMVSLALLTVLSLAWMVRRLRRREAFQPWAGALLRSAYPVVLGLGGWSLVVLAVMATRLPVPLTSPVLTVLAVGGSIGAGIHLAWARPERSARTTRTGAGVAVAGALAGAWLGVAVAPMAVAGVVLAIPGAIALGNLALVVLDLVTTSEARARAATLPDELTPAHVHA